MDNEVTTFQEFFSVMDASHKAVFYRECIHNLKLEKDKEVSKDYLQSILTKVQLEHVRAGF